MSRKSTSQRACVCGNPAGPAKCCQRTVNTSTWRKGGGKIRVGDALKDLQIALNTRQFQQFGVIAEKLLARVPGHPVVQYLLGMAHFANGQMAQARTAMQAGFDRGLHLPEAHLNFANIVGQMGDLPLALRHLRAALEADRKIAKAAAMGQAIATQLGDSEALEWFAQKACEQTPDDEKAWIALVEAQRANIHDQQALQTIAQALVHFSGSWSLRLSKAAILEMQHQLDQSQALLTDLLNEQPRSVDARLLQVRLYRRTQCMADAQKLLEQLQVEAGLTPLQQATLHEELAHLHRLAGRYAAAWEQGLRMNQALREARPPQGDLASLEAQLAAVEALPVPPSNDRAEHAPILFLVGFPRTGSTLVERLINERFDVLSASESEAIPKVEQRIGELCGKPWWELSPEAWAKLPHAELQQLAEQVYQRAAGNRQGVVDKNLMNISRLPLIQWLYPQANVVRVIRHPLDVLVSCFFAPFSSVDAWHSDVTAIARFIARIEQHWASMCEKITKPQVLCYETLAQTGGLSEALLAQLGALFVPRDHPSVGGFFVSRTASYERVVQPVDAQSVATHKRYPAPLLAPLQRLLAEAIRGWEQACDNQQDHG